MFSRMKLAQQLSLGFGVLILFSIIITAFSYKGLKDSFDGVTQYRVFVEDTKIASQLQSTMLMQSGDALSYLSRPDTSTLAHYQEQAELLKGLVQNAQAGVMDNQRAALVKDTSALINEFQQSFETVKEEIAKRDQLINERLFPAGLTMSKTTTSLMENAYLGGDGNTIFYAASVQEHLLLGRLYANKFLVRKDNADHARALKELQEILPNSLALLSDALDGSEEQLLNTFADAHYQYLSALALVYESVTKVSQVSDEKIIRLGAEITERTDQIKNLVQKEQNKLGPALEAEISGLIDLILTVALVIIIIGIVLTMIMVRQIKEPIGGEPARIAGITRKIAEGDLSQIQQGQVEGTGILASVTHMGCQLKQIIGSIADTGNQLQQTAESASAVAQQTNHIVHDQEGRIQQIAAAATEMAASIQEVVRHSESSADAARTGLKFADEGKQTVQQTQVAIQDLASNVEQSVELIQSLEASSANIGSVTEVIQNISEQTNLLALNAAIEAARAGEHGRGFAVVADEVRQLAQRSQDSAQTIQDMINQLQEDINRAVDTMQDSKEKALHTVEQSEKTGEALDTIVSSIEQISDLNTHVVTAVSQQSTVAEEISQNIETVTELSSQTVDGARQTAAASEQLSGISKDLGVIVRHFKL